MKNIKYKTNNQKQAVEAIRASQIQRGCVLSEISMYKMLGIALPFWVCDWPNGKQSRYAIDGAGYNAFFAVDLP